MLGIKFARWYHFTIGLSRSLRKNRLRLDINLLFKHDQEAVSLRGDPWKFVLSKDMFLHQLLQV